MPKHYRLFDLEIVSDFELPEVPLQQINERDIKLPQIRVLAGRVLSSLEQSTLVDGWFWCSPTKALFKFHGIADFMVEGGHTITVALEDGASESDMRVFLFGSAIGAVLHQRQLIPLHISAVDTPYGVWAFTGQSGAGKSTIATALSLKNNWPLLCDDVAVIKPLTNTTNSLSFGVNRVKLWDDAIDLLGISRKSLTRDLIRTEKFHVPGTIEIDHSREYRLSCIVQLQNSDRIEVCNLSPSLTFQTLMNCIYRPSLVHVFGDLQKTTKQILPLASLVRGFEFHRPRSLECFGEGLRVIENAIKKEARL